MTPMAAADSSVSTTPQRSGINRIRAPARTRYCQAYTPQVTSSLNAYILDVIINPDVHKS